MYPSTFFLRPPQLPPALGGDPKLLPDQTRDIISPGVPEPTSGMPPSWTCPLNLEYESTWEHPNQIPESPHLAYLNVEEEQLDFESLPDC